MFRRSLVSKVSNDASVTPLSMNWEGGMDVFVMDDDTNQVIITRMYTTALYMLVLCRMTRRKLHEHLLTSNTC